MAAQGLPVSIAGVAQAYREFLDILIVDARDAKAAEQFQQSGLRVHCGKTIMRTSEEKADLARQVLSLFSTEGAARAGSDLSCFPSRIKASLRPLNAWPPHSISLL